jgi:hypothetical protein
MKINEVKKAANAQLSQAKAEAAENPNEETSALITSINKEFEARAKEQEGAEKLADVRVRAKCETSVDGVKFAKDQEGKLTGKQYNAVSRHFEKLGLIALLALLGMAAPQWAQAQQDNPTYLCQTNDTRRARTC